MFTECERQYLVEMAQKCRARGLSKAETELELTEEIGRFSTPIRIAQAVEKAFHESQLPSEATHSAAIF